MTGLATGVTWILLRERRGRRCGQCAAVVGDGRHELARDRSRTSGNARMRVVNRLCISAVVPNISAMAFDITEQNRLA